MARDSGGTMTRASAPVAFKERPASSAKYNTEIQDIINEMTDSLSRSGKGGMLANLAMGAFRITGIALGTVAAAAVQANGNAGTGVYFPTANEVAIAANGVQSALFNATGISGNGSQLTALNAANITTGTLPVARLNGGNSAQFVRGDGNYSSTLVGSLTLGAAANPRLTIDNNSGTASRFQAGADSSTVFSGGLIATDAYDLYAGGSARTRLTSAGRFDVATNHTTAFLNITDGLGTDRTLIGFVGGVGLRIWNKDNTALSLGANNAEAININGTTRAVVINAPSSGTALEATSAASATAIRAIGGGGGPSSTLVVQSATNGTLAWYYTPAAADERYWDMGLLGGKNLQIRAVNDANSAATNVLTVTRGTGIQVIGVTLNAQNGQVDIQTAGSTRITANSAGNVTVNAPSSGVGLTVSGAAAAGNMRLTTTASTGAGIWYNGATLSDRAFAGMDATGDSVFRIFGAGISGNVQSWNLATGGTTISAPSSGASLTFGQAATQVVPGATSISLRNNANSLDNLLITDAGVATFRNQVYINSATTPLLMSSSGTASGDYIEISRPIGAPDIRVNGNGGSAIATIRVTTTSRNLTLTADEAGGFSSLRIDGNQVVRNRQTGWAAATGTATRTTFATGTVTTTQLAERVKALIDDLTVHGLIGA